MSTYVSEIVGHRVYRATRKAVTMDKQWACEVYGPEGIDVGALCFFAEQGHRACISPVMCKMLMTEERQRVFGRINEMAATGDPAGIELTEYFTSPDQLLGGPATPADQRTSHPGTDQPPPG